jgi:hypothetical protein
MYAGNNQPSQLGATQASQHVAASVNIVVVFVAKHHIDPNIPV